MATRTFLAVSTILGLCAVFYLPGLAMAARWHPKHSQKQTKEPSAESVTLEGVVQSATATQIEVTAGTSKDGDSHQKKSSKEPHGKWTVLVPPHTPIHVTGEATSDYLRPGLMVQFAATGEDQKTASLVHELTIVTAATHKAATPGSTASTSNHKSNPASAPPLKSDAQTVVGQLGHFSDRDHTWPVLAHGKTLHIELADGVQIHVAFTGSHFIKPGDKIVVQGEMVHGKPGNCAADNVQVTLAQPLTAHKDEQKHHPSESEAARATKKAA